MRNKPGILIFKEEQFLELPSKTRRFFVQFINGANRSGLHPLDWKRFYRFIKFCHARRVKVSPELLRSLLKRGGFSEDKATYLAEIYEHCRELLSVR